MRYVGITLAVLAVMGMWCAQGFAAKNVTEYQPYIRPNFLGTPSAGRNPEVSLAPATASRLTPAQFQALEQAKWARNPMTKSNPQAGLAVTNPTVKMGGLAGKQALLSEVPPPSQPPKPFWGTNTTVWTGPLAGNVSGRNNRPTSFDFDTSGNFYALFDSANGLVRILRSTDDGQTWNWIWWFSDGQPILQSKIIVQNLDSLYIYAFCVDANGAAFVFRANQSAGTWTAYTLRADSSVSIDAVWDIDRVIPWFHVAIEKTGAVNDYQIQYVRGTSRGTAWSAPSFVVYNSTYPAIAQGNVGMTQNNLFIASAWNAFPGTNDSSAYVSFDSAGTWRWKKVGGDFNRKETETGVAATHGTGSDSVRVWVTDTHYNANIYPMIYYAYNTYNGQGPWTMNVGMPGGSDITRTYYGSSINIPNWEFGGMGGGAAFVNVSWYADSSSINSLRQNWIGNGWANPNGWAGVTDRINQYTHDTPNASLSYATGAHRSIGSVWSVVIYPGFGPNNVYMNGFWFTGVEQGPAQVTPKTGFELASARPNPLSRTTSIAFSLPKSGYVDLAVYDIAGRKVATLAQGTMSAGSHEVNWNGANAPAGVYLYRLSFEGKTLTNRMVVVR